MTIFICIFLLKKEYTSKNNYNSRLIYLFEKQGIEKIFNIVDKMKKINK